MIRLADAILIFAFSFGCACPQRWGMPSEPKVVIDQHIEAGVQADAERPRAVKK